MSQPTIEDLVRDHLADVYGYAFRLAGNASDAEDLSQQTFLVAIQKVDQLRDTSSARPWLWAITRRLFLAERRRKTPAACGDLGEEPEARQASAGWLEFEREDLDLAIAALSDEQRLMLARYYFEEASYREIAAEFDCPLGTVMSRLARAKRRLRQLLLPASGVRSHDGRKSNGVSQPHSDSMARTT